MLEYYGLLFEVAHFLLKIKKEVFFKKKKYSFTTE